MKNIMNLLKRSKYAAALLCVIMISSLLWEVKASAATEEMPGYTNPEDIIIASPTNNYSTKSEWISILGACDYRYPLLLNGELIETTEYGFFTQYVPLEVGDNIFEFENNGKIKTITINRKKKASSSTSGGTSSGTASAPKVTYKEYTEAAYGKVTSTYAMPRKKISEADVTLLPLTRGTTCKLLGEDGSYYKIADGTYVAKSSMQKFTKKLDTNKVSATNMIYNAEKNLLVTELTMNVNTLYHVSIEGNKVYLTLENTTSVKKVAVPENDTVSMVTVTKDKGNKKAAYCFTLKEGAAIYGYDVLFNNGVMKFEMKVAPHLKEEGNLSGTTVFLDAGHGSNDSGAVGPMGKYGPMEKNTNLAITLYAKEYLEGLGANVVLTRTDDTFLSLSDRVSKIRNLRPDISVSIHGNSLDYVSNYSKASGFLTYYSYQIEGNLPAMINKSIAASLDFEEKAPRQKSLSLTRLTACPAVLLESKFLSNPEDYEYLLKAENQKAFGEAIGKSVQEYLESIAIYPVETYIVQRGDSLLKIAKKFNVTVDELAELNHIKNINLIEVGQKLKIPTK